MLGETRRLDRILEDLLDVSRLEAGEVRARPVACAPEELAADAVAAAAAEMGGADVEVAVERGCPLVLADPFLTERILVNLLTTRCATARRPCCCGPSSATGTST